MALTSVRWIAAALAGCLLAVAYFYSSSDRVPRPEDRRDAIAARERQLGFTVNQAADRLRATMIIDSIQRSLARTRPADSLRVLFGQGFSAPAREAFITSAKRALSALGNPRLPVDVAFVIDSIDKVRGVPRAAGRTVAGEYVLPASDGDRCLSIVRIRAPMTAREADRRLTEIAFRTADRRLLGPCAFVGMYGRPGPHVAEWLARTGWGYTMAAAWSEHTPKWNPPAWYGLQESNADGWPLRFYMSLDGYRCATGQEGSCEVAVMEPSSPYRRSLLPQIWGGRVISATPSDNDWYYRLNLGPRQANFLSDLVNTVGVETFRRFWTSPEPVNEAFAAATGRSLAAATHSWTEAQYSGFVGRGPGVPPLTAALTLLFVSGGALTAVAAARRRRVR